jgi:glycosyltransferase involved in cell wall biosynthesis
MGAATRPGLSACIIARDEEDRLPGCLDSLRFCDELLVVDSHSRDRTRELAAAAGARVIERDWPGHVAQKEFAIRAASHDWVLCVDADERISPELAAEIEALRAQGFDGACGYVVPRRSRYLGRWIRHGTWYPDWKLRLFDRRRGRWGGRDPHDRVEVEGATRRLRGELLHEPYRSFEEHLATIDRYTTTMAEQLHAEGRRAHLLDLVWRPPLRFLGFYVLRGGCLDGWRGLLLAYLAAHYVRLKYAKLWLRSRA